MKNTVPAHWELATKKRLNEFILDQNTTVRLIHDEDPEIRCDRLGSVCWFYCYRKISAEDYAAMADLSNQVGSLHWCAHFMENQDSNPTRPVRYSNNLPEEWVASEEKVNYYFRKSQGKSPGLFLDQRANRRWLRKRSQGLRVLNLFSYTGGFSLNSALGRAKEVVSVDQNRNFLKWSKKNFELNNLQVCDWEFWAADVRYFLQGCIRRMRTFDIIICDPPSFSRSSNGLFRIQHDLVDILQQIDEILAPNGQLLLCTNYEGWDKNSLKKYAREKLPKDRYCNIDLPESDSDTTSTSLYSGLKSIALQKKAGWNHSSSASLTSRVRNSLTA
ncbi:MAG: class I SAM-dependent methyltransferase [Candidatus Latescibacterota bacterium]|nr:class I SAM-dependent methyltransferase [Candidatus Latescibacterota bacterium]